MRRLLLVSVVVVALALVLVGTASADNGPHVGSYTTTTDACGGCHRAHRGKAPKLLKEASQLQLCLSCHGAGTAGADTNVDDGVYMNRDSGGAYGVVDAGLRGGGFTNAVMDPDMDGSPASAAVTSKHNVGDSGLTIWGNGDTGAGKTGVTLECGSCHNPHGFTDQDRYRILKPIPNDSDATSGVDVPDESDKKYTVEYWRDGGHGGPTYLDNYRDPMADKWMSADRDQRFAEWCAQCHTRYLADNFTGTGDPIFNYRHATHVTISPENANILVCQTCHVAHGTSATMGAFSGAVEWPDDTAGGGSGDARLLHVDNRGVCIQCHQEPGTNTGCLSCHNP